MAHDLTEGLGETAPERPGQPGEARPSESPIDRMSSVLLAGGSPQVRDLLLRARERAELMLAGHRGDPALERARAVMLTADVLVGLGADGQLIEADVRSAVAALEAVLEVGPEAAGLLLYRDAVAAPQLYDLPPLTSIGLQLRLLIDLGVYDEVSLWRRADTLETECLIALGAGEISRQTRREARAVLRGRSAPRLAGGSRYRSAPVLRFQQVAGGLVGRVGIGTGAEASAFLAIAARAVEPLIERELLLERSREREHLLVASAERRLTRLAFDLHDGPVQDVLALAGEVRELQRDLDPFIHEQQRDLVRGRFDDTLARLTELDRELRDTAHSLETSSLVSRPLGEVLHRVVDTFAARTGIETRTDIRCDSDALTDSQRIVIFRAVQEALANVREHSSAGSVEVVVRTRRATTDVCVTDDGHGFDVGSGLAGAAKRGRLGVVGISERIRLLGGTFEIDSRPGGPTALRFSLPRWQQH